MAQQAEAAAAEALEKRQAEAARAQARVEDIQGELDFYRDVLRIALDPNDDEFPEEIADGMQEQVATLESQLAEAEPKVQAAARRVEAAEQHFEEAQLATLCALGADLPAAQAQLKAVRYLRRKQAAEQRAAEQAAAREAAARILHERRRAAAAVQEPAAEAEGGDMEPEPQAIE